MKPQVLTPEKNEHLVRTVPKKTEEEDTFENDWANGISGGEVVKIVHEHIKEWWRVNKEDRKV